MEHDEFGELNNIISLLLNDIITNETYIPVMPRLPFQMPLSTVSRSPSQRILQTSLYDRNPIRHVITDEVKKTLIPIKFRDIKDAENNSKCSILFEAFQENDDVIQLPCNHCFFVEPIMKWLTEDSCECPVCRYKFDSMEKNISKETEENQEELQEENNTNDIEQINVSNFINNAQDAEYIDNFISINENINGEYYPLYFNYF
jgi:hypothetical protein